MENRPSGQTKKKSSKEARTSTGSGNGVDQEEIKTKKVFKRKGFKKDLNQGELTKIKKLNAKKPKKANNG